MNHAVPSIVLHSQIKSKNSVKVFKVLSIPAQRHEVGCVAAVSVNYVLTIFPPLHAEDPLAHLSLTLPTRRHEDRCAVV